MSTVLLIGMVTGAVYAIDLRQNYIENRKFINNTYCKKLYKNYLITFRIEKK